jgi:hypothetical protein
VADWVYSDWITYDRSSTTRLERLRLHIQELSDFCTGSYKITNREVKKDDVEKRIIALLAQEQTEAEATDTTSGNRVGFTRARAKL